MPARNIQSWYKFAFQLLVSEQWDVISERVENGDQTYRWLKEQLLLALRNIEKEAWQKRLGGAAFTIKQRIESFTNSVISEKDYIAAQHYLKSPGGRFVLADESCSVRHRVIGAKIALLETAMVNYDEPNKAGAGICDVFNKITDIEPVVDAIYENKDPKLAYEVKMMFDLSKEYAKTMKIPLDDLIELEFEPACLPSEAPEAFKPPETWVFGDYGYEDGQLSEPTRVHVDKEGNYLVMDADIEGENCTQRIQLFNPLGKFMKVILRRGEGKVNGMRDFGLNKDGNIVVADTDDEDKGRIQAFDYEGNQLMIVEIDKDDPESFPRVLSIFIDEDDNIICADMGCSCVRVYSPDGKLKAKFGKWGRQDGNFMNLQIVAASDNKIYTYNHGVDIFRTQVFDHDGTYIKMLWPGYEYSQLVFHTDGQIYAVVGHRIDKLDLDGNHEPVAGKTDGYGGYLEEFFKIRSMVFLPDGRVAVSDSGNHRIQVFKL